MAIVGSSYCIGVYTNSVLLVSSDEATPDVHFIIFNANKFGTCIDAFSLLAFCVRFSIALKLLRSFFLILGLLHVFLYK